MHGKQKNGNVTGADRSLRQKANIRIVVVMIVRNHITVNQQGGVYYGYSRNISYDMDERWDKVSICGI